MAVNPKLLEFEDFYRALVKSCKRPQDHPGLPPLLAHHKWSVALDDKGAPHVTIQNEGTHIEDAYRQFSLDPTFFESFYAAVMGDWA